MTRPHDDERIAAYLDGELAPEELAAFEADLATSADLRAEVDAHGLIRASVIGLPPVDPPAGFFDRVIDELTPRPARSRRGMGVAITAIAAAWAVLLGFGSGLGVFEVVPPVDDLVNQHAAAATLDDDMPMDMDPMPMDDAKGVGPDDMADMELVDAFTSDGLVHLLYQDDEGHAISLFKQSGSLDMDAMPDTGSEMEMNGVPAWQGYDAGTAVVVVDKGSTVFTVIGPDDMIDSVMDMADHLPDSDDDASIVDRVTDALWNLVTFGS